MKTKHLIIFLCLFFSKSFSQCVEQPYECLWDGTPLSINVFPNPIGGDCSYRVIVSRISCPESEWLGNTKNCNCCEGSVSVNGNQLTDDPFGDAIFNVEGEREIIVTVEIEGQSFSETFYFNGLCSYDNTIPQDQEACYEVVREDFIVENGEFDVYYREKFIIYDNQNNEIEIVSLDYYHTWEIKNLDTGEIYTSSNEENVTNIEEPYTTNLSYHNDDFSRSYRIMISMYIMANLSDGSRVRIEECKESLADDDNSNSEEQLILVSENDVSFKFEFFKQSHPKDYIKNAKIYSINGFLHTELFNENKTQVLNLNKTGIQPGIYFINFFDGGDNYIANRKIIID